MFLADASQPTEWVRMAFTGAGIGLMALALLMALGAAVLLLRVLSMLRAVNRQRKAPAAPDTSAGAAR